MVNNQAVILFETDSAGVVVKAECGGTGLAMRQPQLGDAVDGYLPAKMARAVKVAARAVIAGKSSRMVSGELLGPEGLEPVEVAVSKSGEHAAVAVRFTAPRDAARDEFTTAHLIGKLSQLSDVADSSPEEIERFALEECISMTRSAIGFIGFLSDDEARAVIQVWSGNVMAGCAVGQQRTEFDIEKAGLWAEAVRRRTPVIVNDYNDLRQGKKGLPIGHIPLRNMLAVPVLDAGRIVALALVANSDSGYTASDAGNLSAQMTTMWRLIQRRRAMIEREELQRKLIATKRREAVARLSNEFVHIFNNIFNIIVSCGHAALENVDEKSAGAEDVRKMIAGALRAADMLGKLRTYALGTPLDTTSVDLNEVVSDIIEMRAVTTDENISFFFVPGADLPPVGIDVFGINQSLNSIINNSVDAMPAGGTITVQTGLIETGEDFCLVNPDIAPGRYCFIKISDTGTGITLSVLPHIFDPFFTTKDEHRGTGLGLPVALGILHSHGGGITVANSRDAGTDVTLFIPVYSGVARDT